MASSCISNCINDVIVFPNAIRPTYVNLYKWPESDAEFIKSKSFHHHSNRNRVPNTEFTRFNSFNDGITGRNGHAYAHARVVDSLSCRQIYLRSYTFSRKKEKVHEKISRRVKEKVKGRTTKKKSSNNKKGCVLIRNKCVGFSKAKEISSCGVLLSMFRRLLSCTSKVDVAHDDDHHHV